MSCLKLVGYLVIFGILAALTGTSGISWSLLGIAFLVILGYRIYKDQKSKRDQEEAISENIEVQVSHKLADYVKAKAFAIDGDGNYGFRVVGEKYRKENFKELADYMQIDAAETVTVQTQLICQPNNPHDPKAVAVTLGGYLIGYVPRYEAEPLHEFILKHGGVATVNSKIHFDLEKEEFEVDLDITRPFTILTTKPFEA